MMLMKYMMMMIVMMMVMDSNPGSGERLLAVSGNAFDQNAIRADLP